MYVKYRDPLCKKVTQHVYSNLTINLGEMLDLENMTINFDLCITNIILTDVIVDQ